MTRHYDDPERDDWTDRRILASELAAMEREPSAQEMDDRADREARW